MTNPIQLSNGIGVPTLLPSSYLGRARRDVVAPGADASADFVISGLSGLSTYFTGVRTFWGVVDGQVTQANITTVEPPTLDSPGALMTWGDNGVTSVTIPPYTGIRGSSVVDVPLVQILDTNSQAVNSCLTYEELTLTDINGVSYTSSGNTEIKGIRVDTNDDSPVSVLLNVNASKLFTGRPSSILFENCAFNHLTSSVSNWAVLIANADTVKFKNCTFTGLIRFDGCTSIEMIDCLIVLNTVASGIHGVEFDTCTNIFMRDVRVIVGASFGAAKYAVNFLKCNDVTIEKLLISHVSGSTTPSVNFDGDGSVAGVHKVIDGVAILNTPGGGVVTLNRGAPATLEYDYITREPIANFTRGGDAGGITNILTVAVV